MANKSSRAEKAVSSEKKKAAASSAKNGKKASPSKGKTAPADNSVHISGRAIIAIVSIVLFIVFLTISINPEGAFLKLIQNAVFGIIGKGGFYIAIPALLYLFFIQTFGGKTKTAMRTSCLIGFVLTCGCIYHLAVHPENLSSGLAVFTDLFMGGINGTTGGVICGGIAHLLIWALGNTILPYILLITLGTILLLGSMQITLPSIIRAIQNRPRDDYQEEEEENYMEPATVVVNHIANKQIAYKRRKREREAAAPAPSENRKENRRNETPLPEPVASPANAAGVMNTIELDIEAPLGVSAPSPQPVSNQEPAPEKGIDIPVDEEPFLDNIPQQMPELIQRAPEVKQVTPVRKVAPSEQKQPEANQPEMKQKVTAKDAEKSAKEVAQEIAQIQSAETPAYSFPPVELLKRPARMNADGTDEMRENSRRLNETLASFRVDAHIINVTRGPSVTRYEVELDKGVRLNKITGCADDIALSLGAPGVRIAAVPGKISIVGIEVPNRSVTTVSLREVIDSAEFAKAKSKSSFAVGKDIAGNAIIGDIAKMPHMLIAGTTGSGKSVCMNSIIISLLYKAGPEDVKLIMVDPKMVELGIYNGIPQLLIPVVTDPKKAAGSLQWAVTEMLRRYKLMSDIGVRDLESYNSIVMAEENGQKLPKLIIIIDELADLMLVAAKEVEESICRIAQMGRAAGVHLIIATQRPSADVITGLMKANIPSRIAFSVASAMESRIILDTQGAEKLVGKGDMLFSPIGIGKPLRVQGCFVTDTEVEAVAEYVKDNFVSDYSQEVLEEIEKKAQQTGKSKPGGTAAADMSAQEEEGDEMLPAAVDVILETKMASVSMLQRRLKLGYARAARIVDEMEEKGIVGPFQGSKPREILITKEQWASMQGGRQMDFSDLDSSEE